MWTTDANQRIFCNIIACATATFWWPQSPEHLWRVWLAWAIDFHGCSIKSSLLTLGDNFTSCKCWSAFVESGADLPLGCVCRLGKITQIGLSQHVKISIKLNVLVSRTPITGEVSRLADRKLANTIVLESHFNDTGIEQIGRSDKKQGL